MDVTAIGYFGNQHDKIKYWVQRKKYV
jgi:hypothetical protein